MKHSKFFNERFCVNTTLYVLANHNHTLLVENSISALQEVNVSSTVLFVVNSL